MISGCSYLEGLVGGETWEDYWAERLGGIGRRRLGGISRRKDLEGLVGGETWRD